MRPSLPRSAALLTRECRAHLWARSKHGVRCYADVCALRALIGHLGPAGPVHGIRNATTEKPLRMAAAALGNADAGDGDLLEDVRGSDGAVGVARDAGLELR